MKLLMGFMGRVIVKAYIHHTYIFTCVYKYIYTYKHTYVPTHIHTLIRPYILIYINTYTHIRMYANYKQQITTGPKTKSTAQANSSMEWLKCVFFLVVFRCPTWVSPQARRSPTLARGAAWEGAVRLPATTPPRPPIRTTGNSSNNSSSNSSKRPQDNNNNNNNRRRCSVPTSLVAFVGAAVVAAHGEYYTPLIVLIDYRYERSVYLFLSFLLYLCIYPFFVVFLDFFISLTHFLLGLVVSLFSWITGLPQLIYCMESTWRILFNIIFHTYVYYRTLKLRVFEQVVPR